MDNQDNSLSEGTALQIDKLTELSNKYLTEDTQKALSNIIPERDYRTKDGLTYVSCYFVVRVKKGNHEKAVEALSFKLNELASEGKIRSCLSPLSTISFNRNVFQTAQDAVFCFIHVLPADRDLLKLTYPYYVEEGGSGISLDDERPQLEEGEFLASANINFLDKESEQDQLKKQIDSFLAILPEGTIVRDIAKCAIVSLNFTYEIKFYNPLMKKVKKVETVYVRQVERVGEEIKHFNLILGIRYFDADNNDIYKCYN